MNIRDATQHDVSFICALGNNVEEFLTSEVTDMFWPESILRECIHQDTTILLVAEDGGTIVGFLIANLNKPLSKALVENLYVHHPVRHQGIATRLLQTFIARSIHLNFKYISVLTPEADEHAIEAYRKVGFKPGRTFLWLDLT